MKYKLYENNKVLVVGPVTKELEGRLMCKSESKSGVIVAYSDVTVINVVNLGEKKLAFDKQYFFLNLILMKLYF